MAKFNLYVHGVPIGHDIWGASEDLSYIKTFYNHDADVKESVIFCIEALRNKTFYSYLRQNDVDNAESRPGSYFGITLSFSNLYCSNVYLLYKIFDAVYKQLCLGKLIEQDGRKVRYLVRQFIDDTLTLEKINAAFTQQIDKLLTNSFLALDDSAKPTGIVKYSLSDVDSPAFIESFKSKKILVSPDYISKEDENASLQKQVQPLRMQCEQLSSEILQWKNKYAALEQSNIVLQNQITPLEKKVESLESQLVSVVTDTTREFKQKLEETKGALDKSEKEVEILTNTNKKAQDEIKKLREDIKVIGENKDINNSVAQIREPLKNLARLMASRFPDDPRKGCSIRKKNFNNHGASNLFKTWISVINCVLLCCVVAIGVWYYSHPAKINEDNYTLEDQKVQIEQIEQKVQKLTQQAEATLTAIQKTSTEMQAAFKSRKEDSKAASREASKKTKKGGSTIQGASTVSQETIKAD